MPKKTSTRKKKPDTGMAFVATFFSIFGVLIALVTKRDDKYVMFYANQSITLFIFSFVVSIAGLIPLIGKIISIFGGILIFVLWVMLWVYSLSGERKSVPVLGDTHWSFF